MMTDDYLLYNFIIRVSIPILACETYYVQYSNYNKLNPPAKTFYKTRNIQSENCQVFNYGN